MKKKACLVLFVLVLSRFAFAYEGLMSGQKDLKIVSTKYFDIIYAEKSLPAAKILFEKADCIYDDLKNQLGLKYDFRLPVVISPSQDVFNAYFSFAPYNHIVMFDTIPDEDMAVFSESFINTFKHELTHAVTYNLKGRFWHGIGNAFGDSYNPAVLFITQSFAEGAAVSLESQNGEGRLNNEYSKHIVKQAKIENKFPKYSEINGARDVYPYSRVSYIFGGLFNRWLQENFGMEKYALFWYKCVNFRTISYLTCFKKVYGISIKTAWRDFIESVEIPTYITHPYMSESVSVLNAGRKLSQYASISYSDRGIAFVDSYSNTAYLIDKNNRDFPNNKASVLFKLSGLRKVSFSEDGDFLAVSYTKNSVHPENRVAIYNMKTRRFFYAGEKSLRDAAIFRYNGQLYFSAVKTEGRKASLFIYLLVLGKKGNIENSILVDKIENEDENFIFSPIAGGKKVYFISNQNMCFSIESFDMDSKHREKFEFPKKFSIRNLSYFNNILSFSCVEKNRQPFIGYINFNDKEIYGQTNIYLHKEDFSGGMFFPVKIDDEHFIYTGEFFEGNRIYSLKTEEKDFFPIPVLKISLDTDSKISQKEKFSHLPDFSSDKFSLCKYMFDYHKGTLIPFSLSATHYIDQKNSSLGNILLPFGVTYVSSSPWTVPIYYYSAGYNPLSNSGAMTAGIMGGTTTPLFSYNALGTVEFDDKGYKQTYINGRVSSEIPIFRKTKLVLKDSLQILEGRESEYKMFATDFSDADFFRVLFKSLKNDDETKKLFADNNAEIGFSNIARSGNGYYENCGISFSTIYNINYSSSFEDFGIDNFEHSLGFSFLGAVPRLIPVKTNGQYSFNMPALFSIKAFPITGCLGSGKAKLCLFSSEIQKSTNFLPLVYVNRTSIWSVYSAGIFSPNSSLLNFSDTVKNINNLKYIDLLSYIFSIDITPNLGAAANPMFKLQFEVSANCSFFNTEERFRFYFDLGIKTAL